MLLKEYGARSGTGVGKETGGKKKAAREDWKILAAEKGSEDKCCVQF